jgi:hypothetical protein
VRRRTFLMSGIGMLGVSALGYGSMLTSGALQLCPTPGTLGGMVDTPLARIGDVYLRKTASQLEATQLREVAASIPSHLTGGASDGLWRAVADLAASISHDFEVGNVVSCDGWVLSRSEARMCALIALTC